MGRIGPQSETSPHLYAAKPAPPAVKPAPAPAPPAQSIEDAVSAIIDKEEEEDE